MIDPVEVIILIVATLISIVELAEAGTILYSSVMSHELFASIAASVYFIVVLGIVVFCIKFILDYLE